MFGLGTKFSGRDGYHSRTRASLTRPQTPDDTRQIFSLADKRAIFGQTALDLTCGFGSRIERYGRRAPDPRADKIRRAAERSHRAAERSCRRRAAPQPRLSADCDLIYLLTGVFNAPASGVSERRPTRGTDRRIYNYYYNYYIPDILLYFTELVYSNTDIPVDV